MVITSDIIMCEWHKVTQQNIMFEKITDFRRVSSSLKYNSILMAYSHL